MPVHFCDEIDARRAAVQSDALSNERISKTPGQEQGTAQRTVLLDNRFYKLIDLPHFFLVVDIHIPGVEIHRLIFKELEHVPTLAWSQNIARTALIPQGNDLASGIEADRI